MPPCVFAACRVRLRTESRCASSLAASKLAVPLYHGKAVRPGRAVKLLASQLARSARIWDEEMVAAVTTVESSIEDADLELLGRWWLFGPLQLELRELAEHLRSNMAMLPNQWYRFGIGEFTTHVRLPILVVGLNRMFTGGSLIWVLKSTWPYSFAGVHREGFASCFVPRLRPQRKIGEVPQEKLPGAVSFFLLLTQTRGASVQLKLF